MVIKNDPKDVNRDRIERMDGGRSDPGLGQRCRRHMTYRHRGISNKHTRKRERGRDERLCPPMSLFYRLTFGPSSGRGLCLDDYGTRI